MTRTLALGAAAWAVLFAIPSALWALGSTIGLETIADDPDEFEAALEDATGLGIAVILWLITAAKLLGAGLALSFLPRLHEAIPARALRRMIAGAGGALSILYGAASLVQHALYATGLLDRPAEGNTAILWHLWFWDPWWILGSALFLAIALAARRAPSAPVPPP